MTVLAPPQRHRTQDPMWSRLAAPDQADRAAQRRDAFRWGATGDLLVARREIARGRRHAAEALLRRAEAAVLDAWGTSEGLAGDPGPRDRSYGRIIAAISDARAALSGPGDAAMAAAEERILEAVASLRRLEGPGRG